MSARATARLLPVEEAYRLWASEYDSAPNPLLCLEERHLASLLEQVTNRDVIDLGCGTGRWLARIAALQPRSMTGVDLSAEMLERTAARVGSKALLVKADCVNTQVAIASADWILASFLLSYVKGLDELASETARIAGPGARLVFSDVHPATQDYRWKRTFRCGQEVIEIETHPYKLDDLHMAMGKADWELEEFSEHCFEEEEKTAFFHAGRLDLFEAVKGLPVLFLARYRRRCG